MGLPDWLNHLLRSLLPDSNKDQLARLRSRLDEIPTSRILRHSRLVRKGVPPEISRHFRSPKELRRLLDNSDDKVTIAILASLDPNGYVRETATQALDELSPPADLRWLVLRCSDWVGEVRAAAIRSVESRFQEPVSEEDTAALAPSVFLIMRNVMHEETRELFTYLRSVLLQEPARTHLLKLVGSDDYKTGRAALRLLLDCVDPGSLLPYIRTDDVVAMNVVQRTGLSDPRSCEQVMRLGLASTRASFRAEALWHGLHHDHHLEDAELHAALVDRAGLVRDVAQRYLSAQGLSPRLHYRTMLEDQPALALRGLGDVGEVEDVSDALAYVDDSRATVRQGALRVIGRFGGPDTVPLLITSAVQDGGTRSRLAMQGILRHGLSNAVVESLWHQLSQRGDEGAWRRMLLKMLPSTQRWIALEYGLRGCALNDPVVTPLSVSSVERLLARWNESFTGPPEGLIPRLGGLLANCRTTLPDTQYKGVESILKMKW